MLLVEIGGLRVLAEFNVNYVSEKDIDLLIIEEFAANIAFANIFVTHININKYQIEALEHSVTDVSNGESDIRIILSSNGKRIALLIEDKISAMAMPQQASRYEERGRKGIIEGLYDSYYVFLAAPQKYYDSNEEAKKYPYYISYESLFSVLKKSKDIRSKYKVHLIESAIERAKTPYQVIKDDAVTLFWDKYIDDVIHLFPDLNINTKKSARGSKSQWPVFHTFDKRVKIRHKSDRGYVDLEFSGTAPFIRDIESYLRSQKLIGKQFVGTAGKSSVVRYHVPILDFKSEYRNQHELVHQCLENVRKAYILLNKLDLSRIYYA